MNNGLLGVYVMALKYYKYFLIVNLKSESLRDEQVSNCPASGNDYRKFVHFNSWEVLEITAYRAIYILQFIFKMFGPFKEYSL